MADDPADPLGPTPPMSALAPASDRMPNGPRRASFAMAHFAQNPVSFVPPKGPV